MCEIQSVTPALDHIDTGGRQQFKLHITLYLNHSHMLNLSSEDDSYALLFDSLSFIDALVFVVTLHVGLLQS